MVDSLRNQLPTIWLVKLLTSKHHLIGWFTDIDLPSDWLVYGHWLNYHLIGWFTDIDLPDLAPQSAAASSDVRRDCHQTLFLSLRQYFQYRSAETKLNAEHRAFTALKIDEDYPSSACYLTVKFDRRLNIKNKMYIDCGKRKLGLFSRPCFSNFKEELTVNKVEIFGMLNVNFKKSL